MIQAWGGINRVLCDDSHANITDGVWSKTHVPSVLRRVFSNYDVCPLIYGVCSLYGVILTLFKGSLYRHVFLSFDFRRNARKSLVSTYKLTYRGKIRWGKVSPGKIFVTWPIFRHFSPTNFSPKRQIEL